MNSSSNVPSLVSPSSPLSSNSPALSNQDESVLEEVLEANLEYQKVLEAELDRIELAQQRNLQLQVFFFFNFFLI